MSKPRICIDFDATIFDGAGIITGCVEALNQLQTKYSVAIFSARQDKCREWMIDFLTNNNVPHDEILPPKPEAVAYIDDKGHRFETWEKVMSFGF